MPPFAVSHQKDDEDLKPKELVGSKDLRETFKDKDRVRGSFYLNGIHFYNFQANTPASVVSSINAQTGRSGVTASIDDQGHLVLLNSGPRDIRIGNGAPFDEAPAQGTGDVATDVVNKLKGEVDRSRDDRNGGPKNTILDDLGLEATEDQQEGQAARPGFETGMSAEDREKAREAASQGQAAGSQGPSAGVAGQAANPSTNPSAPVAETGGAGGKMASGEGRTGTGYGYSDQPDGTRAVPGTPAADANQSAAHPQANVAHQSPSSQP